MLWSAGASLNSRFRQLCLILPLMMLISCQNEEASSLSPSALAPVTAVRVSPISLGQQPELLHFASVTRVRQRATLTFQVNGVLRERNAELGQLIEQGQLLATIHNPALEPARDAAAASLAQLQTEADQAERELLRLETLYQRDIVPLQDLEQQRSRVESLQAALNTARANLSQAQRLLEETRLMAPFSGSVESVIREPGEFVQAGQPVLRISAAEGLEAEIRIPAHLQSGLSLGQSLPVRLPMAGINTTGTVIDIGVSNTSDIALYPVVVALHDNRLQTGASVEIGIPLDQRPQLVAPMAAVMRSADGTTVFVVENDTVRRTPINVLRIRGEFVELAPDSLPVGTQLVYAGLTRLADGDRIRVLP